MRKIFSTILLLLLSLSVAAQSADSVAFVSARRQKFRFRKAEGYTISTTLFNSPQVISVIKFSPKDFALRIVQPEDVAPVSEMGEMKRADFAINACFWAVSTSMPTSFVKDNGAILSSTHPAAYPRVNGLVMMHNDRLEIVRSYDMPDYPSVADRCDNICAVGPVLIDDGEVLSYMHFVTSEDIKLRRQKNFLVRRHPRSAIGCDEKGNIYMIVVDGRAKGLAAGATIPELTKICSWLGLVEAINLDGGGSSTLWSRRFGVINHPCDNRKFDHEGERRVSSSIVAIRRKR